MNYQKLYPSKYLSALDLDGMEQAVFKILSIRHEAIQNPEGGTEEKPVLRFEDTEKGLILNRTNADTIAGLYGSEVESWTGKRITLFVEKDVHAFGKKWDVVRIRGQAPPDGNDLGSAWIAESGEKGPNPPLPTQDELAF